MKPEVDEGQEGLVGQVMVQELAQQAMVYLVEEVVDIGIKDVNVTLSAQASDVGNGIFNTETGTITEAAIVETGIEPGLQLLHDSTLQDAVGDGGNAEDTHVGGISFGNTPDAEGAGLVMIGADITGKVDEAFFPVTPPLGDGDVVYAGAALVVGSVIPGTAEVIESEGLVEKGHQNFQLAVINWVRPIPWVE